MNEVLAQVFAYSWSFWKLLTVVESPRLRVMEVRALRDLFFQHLSVLTEVLSQDIRKKDSGTVRGISGPKSFAPKKRLFHS